MNAPGVALFTASEFAKVLRCAPQYVRKLLRHTQATAQKVPLRSTKRGAECIAGKLADAWEIGSLPSPLERRLDLLQKKLGYSAKTEMMVNELAQRTTTAGSLARVAPDKIDRAQKLQRAFASSLAMPAETSISERARIAAPHYAREFGKEVSDRYLRKLLDRILEADCGRRNFSDLTIYIRKEHSRTRRAKRSAVSGRFDFRELDEQLREITDRANPTVGEVDFAWQCVIKFFRERCENGADSEALKFNLRGHLLRIAPFLAASPAALKRNFNRKLRDTERHGLEVLLDGRLNAERVSKRPSDFDANIELCAKHTVEFCHRRESQAHRQLHEGTTPNGERYSEEFRMAYPFDVRTAKSRMNEVVRRAVTRLVEKRWPAQLGPRAVRDARPKVQRDWDDVCSGDYIVADDTTGNHETNEFRPDGEFECARGRFNFGRPQVLFVFDELTTFVLGFAVALTPRPEQWSVFEGLVRVLLNQNIGLPRCGLTLEYGSYDTHLVRGLGNVVDVTEEFARAEIDLTIQRVKSPTAKSQAEGPIGRLQSLFDYGNGFQGRNERRITFERVQQFEQKLKRFGQPRKDPVDPALGSMSLEDYVVELEKVVHRYNNEPQNGRILRDANGRGLSPAEGWQCFFGNRPMKVLPECLRHRVATKSFEQKVTTDGVRVPVFKGVESWYRDGKLLQLVGERVRFRFNPQCPDHVTVVDLANDPKERSPFSVPLARRVPAKGAIRQDFEASYNGALAPYGKTIFREFAPPRNLTISSSSWASADTRAAGEAYNRLEREHIDLTVRRDRERSSISRLAAANNRAINPRNMRNPERVKRHSESAVRGKQRILELEKEPANLPEEDQQ